MLRNAPGVKVVDDPTQKQYPMPLTASGQWDVEVGRIRRNEVFGEYGLDLFVSGDQVWKICHIESCVNYSDFLNNLATLILYSC